MRGMSGPHPVPGASATGTPHLPVMISSPRETNAKAPSRYLLILSPSSPVSGVPQWGVGVTVGGPGWGLGPCRHRSPSMSLSLLVQHTSSTVGPRGKWGDLQGGSAPKHCQHRFPQTSPL